MHVRPLSDVEAAARQREANAHTAIERERAERAEREIARRAEAQREAEQLQLERVAEGKWLTEGFVAGGRVEFRTQDSDWLPGTVTKVVADGHVKCVSGLAWLEVRPDEAIPGYYLRRGEPWVSSLRTEKRVSAGVYERVRLA